MDYHDTNFIGSNSLDPFYGHNRARMAREQEAHVMTFEEMITLLPGALTEPPRDGQEHPPQAWPGWSAWGNEVGKMEAGRQAPANDNQASLFGDAA